MTDLYKAIRDDSDNRGEHRDCSVTALAVHLGGDYAGAWEAFNKAGRTPRRGVYFNKTGPVAYAHAGLALVDAHDVLRGKRRHVRNVGRYLPKGKRCVIGMRGHVAAWDGEKIVDWSANRKKLVNRVWLVEETEKPKPWPVGMTKDLFGGTP